MLARLFACSLLLAAISPFSGAQERRTTLVVEVAAENRPVPDAVIETAGSVSRSGADGTARLTVGLGETKVSVAAPGFLPASTTLMVDDASREWRVRFELQPAPHEEEEITVFATRTDKRLQDIPTRVEVLAREEIEEKMLMAPGDITMLLNEMGGMRVQTTSPALGAASVRIQGMRGRYTRFLSDGLPLFGQQGGGLGLLQIPPMDLGQVEVIKGISSALYGSGALGGVVNLITRRPAERPVYEGLVNRSTLGGTDATTFLASKLNEHWGASFLAGGHWQQRRDLDDDGWADLASYRRAVLRPRLFWDNGAGHTAFLTGGLTDETRKGGSERLQEALETQRYDFGGIFQSATSSRLVLTARTGVSEQHHDHTYPEAGERDRHRMAFAEISARGVNGRNTWVAGAAVERDAYIPRDVPRFRYTYVTPAVFVQDDVDFTSWLSVSASARVDFHSRYGTFFSPRLAALLRWGGWTGRISAGQGFFAPVPLTEETESAGLSRLVIPLALAAERGRGMTADVTRSVGPASFTATFFASRIRNAIDVERGESYQLINQSSPARNTGFEFLATLREAPFTITGSYTYVRGREFELGQYADVPLTPRHSAGLVGMWEKEDVGRFGLECYYTGQQRLELNPYRSVSRPCVIVGALVERRVGPLRLFFNAENIGNVRQTRWDPLLRRAPGVDGRWAVDAWAPLDGRVFNGGVRLRF